MMRLASLYSLVLTEVSLPYISWQAKGYSTDRGELNNAWVVPVKDWLMCR